MEELTYQLENVIKRYTGREVLSIESLSIPLGGIFGLVGPNGSGKSTLLRLLNFLEPPTEGTIIFGGRHCSDGNGKVPLEVRRRVTMVFQRPILLSSSVRQNVAFGLKVRGEKGIEGRVMEALERVGLVDFAEVSARILSAGEGQRVALARAMVIEPEVLLLDEPTANLDPYNAALIERIVGDYNREQGTTIVLVTHNVFQAKRLAHRVALLLEGRIVEVGEASHFFESPQDPRASAFVRGEMIY